MKLLPRSTFRSGMFFRESPDNTQETAIVLNSPCVGTSDTAGLGRSCVRINYLAPILSSIAMVSLGAQETHVLMGAQF
jgi:hypothetical protein